MNRIVFDYRAKYDKAHNENEAAAQRIAILKEEQARLQTALSALEEQKRETLQVQMRRIRGAGRPNRI